MSLLRSLSTCVLSAALLLFLAVPASALIIDSFDDSAVAVADSGTPVDTDGTPAGSFLGVRTLKSVWASGPNSVDSEIDAGGSSLYNISLGADTLGTSVVGWESIGGADLTAGGTLNALSLEIAFDDLPIDIMIQLTDTLGFVKTLTLSAPGGIFVPTQMDFLFADFVGGAMDFTDVDKIGLLLDATFPATDIQIDFIESTFVPEPSTGLLVAGGLIALGARRRQA